MMLHIKRMIVLFMLLTLSVHAQAELIKFSDQSIQVEYTAALNKQQRHETFVWLQQVADALRTVYGKWPKDRINIRVKTSDSKDSAVPWGEVTRGTPDEVLLVINPDAGFEQITSDWTAFHELSHLLIPYQGYGDLWFSEGLATYYQNIIQSRAGLMSEQTMWNKIASGFERGHQQNNLSTLDLEQISSDMRKYRNFMRVHWSGVHYWLSADIKLRQLSQNNVTLDSVLKALKNCCYDRSMSASAIAEKLDELANANLDQPNLEQQGNNKTLIKIFKPAFETYKASHAMPDYAPVLASLGVSYNSHDSVVLSQDAPNAEIRKRIFTGNVN